MCSRDKNMNHNVGSRPYDQYLPVHIDVSLDFFYLTISSRVEKKIDSYNNQHAKELVPNITSKSIIKKTQVEL